VCDDLEPARPEDEQPDEADDDEREDLNELLAELGREQFGNMPPEEDVTRDESAPPTPGERVLYALGQMHRLHLSGALPVHPRVLRIEDVARIVGVAGELEFTSEDRYGQHAHFPGEVLYVHPSKPFPWRLLSACEWAVEQETNAFLTGDGD